MRRIRAEVLNRCVVFPAAAVSVGASIPKTLRDANGQPWWAG
jgi:hypothetical protein